MNDTSGLERDMLDQNATGQFEGKLLLAMPSLAESVFERSIIYVCAHSEDGAMGIQVNKTTDMTVGNLIKKTSVADKFEGGLHSVDNANMLVLNGGPVEEQRGFVLHSADYESEATTSVSPSIRLTSDIDILQAVLDGSGPQHVVIALGYVGWGAGQLETEIAENSWLVFDASDDIIYETKHALKYNAMLSQMGIDPVNLTLHSGSA